MASADDKGFNGKISQCIDRALDTFGEGVKRSLYYQMETKYHLSRQVAAVKPELVIELLRIILGPTGSSLIERLIVREIRITFELNFGGNSTLEAVMKEARQKFLDVSS